jgi:16S rRNA (cytosine967-C5)-methyltransferase
MSKLQAHLITGLAPLVRADGSLVYSTCSVMSEENDDVVDGFLASAAGARFRPMDLDRMLPAAWRPYVGRDGRFRSLPSAGGPDGHFVAAFERVD